MKKIYLIRHGESIHNYDLIHQPDETPLSEQGRQQAGLAADAFSGVPIDCIISSPLERAYQTATILGEKYNVQVTTEQLLVEVKVPSMLYGKPLNDPEVLAVRAIIKNNTQNVDWHYSDEENFHDRVNRVKKILFLLEELQGEHIVVVTHSALMITMLTFLIEGAETSSTLLQKVMSAFSIGNTGISTLRLKEKNWKVITWNDTKHLN